MDYLVYVTHDAENLQFYLWMVDYFKRFQCAPEDETRSSMPWSSEATSSPKWSSKGRTSLSTVDVADRSAEDISDSSTIGDHHSYFYPSVNPPKSVDAWYSDYHNKSDFCRATFDAQPFRSEINQIASHYIVAGSPRELNLSHKDRTAILDALSHTTHPSAFGDLKNLLDATLRHEAHPNFIRWSICNGNTPRTYFLRGLAIMNITFGFIIATLLTLSSASRWFRIIAAAAWWLGITNLIAAYQGLCVILHRLHTRAIRPWEITDLEDGSYHSLEDQAGFRTNNIRFSNMRSRWPVRMEIFGPSNNYLKDPWVRKYRRKSTWNKISDRKVKVQEKGLRIMQNKIVRQAEAWALIITIPLTAAFVALPKGNFF